MSEQINTAPETRGIDEAQASYVPSVDSGITKLRDGDTVELDGPVFGEFVQTEDEVGAEVLAQETVH